MPIETLVCSLALGVGILILLILFLLYKVTKLTRGANGHSLEGSIQHILKTEQEHHARFVRITAQLASIEERMRSVVHNVRTHRFDPFEGSGSAGKQSFAVALLDIEGNGAVISSLSTHDKVRVFAKPISSFTSTHELSDEEKKVIAASR
jgi:hypothetical protein